MSDDHDGCEWVNVSSGTRVLPDQRVICVCLVVHAHLLFIYIMLCTITVTSVCATETLPTTQPVEEEEGRITRITSGATSVFTAQGS